MKTQIKELRSGTKSQILNEDITYKTPLSGTSQHEVAKVWKKIVKENPTHIDFKIGGFEARLLAFKSVSGKSTWYSGSITREQVEELGIKRALREMPGITMSTANYIEVSNGKGSRRTLCPSLITIL